MSDTITISYVWNREIYLKAAKEAYDYELSKSNKRYLGWFFIALTQFGVAAAMKKGSAGLLLISTFLVLYWYLFRWPLRKRVIERTFDKLSNANLKYILELSKDTLKINEKMIPLKDIDHVLVSDDGIFLYLADESLFVPSVAFSTIEQRSDFLDILKNAVSSYARREQ